MTYEQVMDMVIKNPFDNWTYFDEYDEFVLKSDVNLRIIRSSFDEREEFYENWATNHPDSSAYRYTYSIFYNNSRIDEFYLVSVDGSRATIPMPRINTNNIPRKQYLFAKAVDNSGRLDEYIERSELVIETHLLITD